MVLIKGTISRYFTTNGFGFIRGEDGEDYFLHVSKVKSATLPESGYTVDFTPSQGEKGLVALDITVTKTVQRRPEFITFGETRLRLSNIREYGIAVETRTHKTTELKPTNYLVNLLAAAADDNFRLPIEETKMVPTYHKYLYISTRQNHNYRWYEDESSFSIHDKCKELDALLSNTT